MHHWGPSFACGLLTSDSCSDHILLYEDEKFSMSADGHPPVSGKKLYVGFHSYSRVFMLVKGREFQNSDLTSIQSPFTSMSFNLWMLVSNKVTCVGLAA